MEEEEAVMGHEVRHSHGCIGHLNCQMLSYSLPWECNASYCGSALQ
jgi:hypothetical protein